MASSGSNFWCLKLFSKRKNYEGFIVLVFPINFVIKHFISSIKYLVKNLINSSFSTVKSNLKIQKNEPKFWTDTTIEF